MLADLVVSHYTEDLSWLAHVDRNKYRIVVVSKTLPHATIFCPENVGDEASAYLNYIVQHYDNLPEFCVFIHGHQRSWHHVGDMNDLVNSLPLCTATGYHNFNARSGEPDDGFYVMFVEESGPGPHHQNEYQTWREISPRLFGGIGGFPVPENKRFRFRCCAQFMVHRDFIRRHSKSEWETLLRDLLSACRDRTSAGHCYEFSWCLLLTGWWDEKAWDDWQRPKAE